MYNACNFLISRHKITLDRLTSLKSISQSNFRISSITDTGLLLKFSLFYFVHTSVAERTSYFCLAHKLI